MNILESKLYKEYPRVTPTADMLGFSYEDINKLMIKLENDIFASEFYDNINIRQVVLKAILARMGLNSHDFFNYIKENQTNHWTYEKLDNLKRLVGTNQVPAIVAILS